MKRIEVTEEIKEYAEILLRIWRVFYAKHEAQYGTQLFESYGIIERDLLRSIICPEDTTYNPTFFWEGKHSELIEVTPRSGYWETELLLGIDGRPINADGTGGRVSSASNFAANFLGVFSFWGHPGSHEKVMLRLQCPGVFDGSVDASYPLSHLRFFLRRDLVDELWKQYFEG